VLTARTLEARIQVPAADVVVVAAAAAGLIVYAMTLFCSSTNTDVYAHVYVDDYTIVNKLQFQGPFTYTTRYPRRGRSNRASGALRTATSSGAVFRYTAPPCWWVPSAATRR
jgi:hypothetical protein